LDRRIVSRLLPAVAGTQAGTARPRLLQFEFDATRPRAIEVLEYQQAVGRIQRLRNQVRHRIPECRRCDPRIRRKTMLDTQLLRADAFSLQERI
jgi:hypothetical protein